MDLKDIAEVFDLLERLVGPPPRVVTDDPEGTAAAWLALLGHLERDALRRASVEYARSGGRFWPSAGQLLALAPKPVARPQLAGVHPFPTFANLGERGRQWVLDRFMAAGPYRDDDHAFAALERLAIQQAGESHAHP